MPEYLDIVDEQDKVKGKDTRENVHALYEIHRGVHVFVVNSKGEILLQKRSKNKDYYPGFYDASVGAQVLSGESYEEAAIRETREELGFVPRMMEKISNYNSYSDRQREKRTLFICYHEGPFEFDKTELESVNWYTPAKLVEEIRKGKMKFTEGFKISFEKFLNTKRSF